ncbi:MAG: hypothetical protein WC682_00240 [Parcubacteria group bacterium]|jgi:hypothetical protein
MSNKLKKIIFHTLLLVSIISFVPSYKAQAYVAWPDIGNAFMRTMLNEMWIQIRAAIIGALKKEAINTISETINGLVGGNAQEEALYVQDWADYLFQTPTQNTNLYMNDFFTLTNRGQSSGSYTSSSGSSSSYSEWRSEGAKYLTESPDYTELQSDYEEYASDAASMFDDGNWAAYDAFWQLNNNPIAYELQAEAIYMDKLAEEEKIASDQAQAYSGFKAKKSDDGTVITPGSTIEGLTVAANTVDNDAIANARNIGEIAGIVVGKIASNVIKQGIGNARKNSGSSSSNTCDSSSSSLKDQLNNYSSSGNTKNGNSGLGTLGTSSNSTCD